MTARAARQLRLVLAGGLLLACANAQDPSFGDDDATTGGRPLSLGGTTAGRAGAASSGGQAAHGGQTASAGTASHAGNGGASGGGAGDGGGGSGKVSAGGATGSAGSSSSSAGASSGNAGSAGATGNGGQGGGPNGPVMCEEATATVLGSMSSNVTVASNACLKMSLPADQAWIKKVTLQPEAGMYPLSFSWSNCGTNSSGAFTANYANVVLNPVTAECPIFVKLGGSGSPINVQWWGG